MAFGDESRCAGRSDRVRSTATTETAAETASGSPHGQRPRVAPCRSRAWAPPAGRHPGHGRWCCSRAGSESPWRRGAGAGVQCDVAPAAAAVKFLRTLNQTQSAGRRRPLAEASASGAEAERAGRPLPISLFASVRRCLSLSSAVTGKRATPRFGPGGAPQCGFSPADVAGTFSSV